MNDAAPLPPPPADANPVGTSTAASDTTTTGRLRHPAALFATALAIALAVAIALGLGVGFAVMAASASSCTPSDGWCGLGAAIAGLFFGVIAATISYVVAGIVTIRRFRPRGERARHIAAHLAFPITFWAALALLDLVLGTLLGW